MQFSILALFATGALATGILEVCPSGLYSNPQCCDVDVLGILGLDCESPHIEPFTGVGFRNVCAAKGKKALCCVLPVADQDVLCQEAVGQVI